MRGHLRLGPQRVLIDTSAYFALVVPQDARHLAAATLLERLEQQPTHLFTTNFIVAETHALLLARRGRVVASRVLHQLDQSSATIVRVSLRDERQARQIIERYDDKDFSLTDATSFAVMERLRIDVAFTFDRNFAQYGFQVLDSAG